MGEPGCKAIAESRSSAAGFPKEAMDKSFGYGYRRDLRLPYP
jgi:hypothetical protein